MKEHWALELQSRGTLYHCPEGRGWELERSCSRECTRGRAGCSTCSPREKWCCGWGLWRCGHLPWASRVVWQEVQTPPADRVCYSQACCFCTSMCGSMVLNAEGKNPQTAVWCRSVAALNVTEQHREGSGDSILPGSLQGIRKKHSSAWAKEDSCMHEYMTVYSSKYGAEWRL